MEAYEMTNYLNETYNGSENNMLANSAYYCYTIFDPETGKYYSGSRGIEGHNCHDLLTKYFTSSTVMDFKNKLKKFPELFKYRVEYFKSRIDAFSAEKNFHQKHRVGKNPLFINSIDAGGTNCGAGTVLCRSSDGTIYRVTVEEFSSGKHQHVSKGMMNIRTNNGIKKILISEYNPEIHVTEFKNYVLALDTISNKTCRIPEHEFKSNPKYVGITAGLVVVYDTVTKSRKSVTKEEFINSNGRYVGNTYGLVPVIDKKDGTKKMIPKQDYHKDMYFHSNTGNVVVFSLVERKNVKITKEEYAKNINNYANQTTKCFFKVDGIFFKSKELLNDYYKKTRGKSVLKVSQYLMSTKFKDIEIITKEEYTNGKN